MARELTAYSFAATMLAVPAGFSNALYVVPMAGEISSILKQFSGGSLEIMQAGVSFGNGITQMAVATAAGQGYLMGTGESVNNDGSARYYLCATGATAVAYKLIGLSQGF